LDGVRKIKAAIRKTEYPLAGPIRCYELVSGGESPQFLLLADRANWAAFEPPTSKTLDAMMEAAYGKEQGAAILLTVRSAIRSQYLEAWQYRGDLSFVPESKVTPPGDGSPFLCGSCSGSSAQTISCSFQLLN
jgi:hypothetical protein